jgi:pyruvate kinase
VLHTLGILCGADAGTLPPYPSEEAVFSGTRIIARHAEELFGPTKPDRPTRIMVTLPSEAADDPALLAGLLEAGMDCVRINCAHDDESVWQRMLDNLRARERALGLATPVPVLMDWAGPRCAPCGPRSRRKDRYAVGDRLLLTGLDVEEVRRRKPGKSDATDTALPVVGCSLSGTARAPERRDSVYIDDGQTRRPRDFARHTRVQCSRSFRRRLKGRKIRSDKGINFPETDFQVASLTEKDRRDLRFVAQHADMIGYSFVQTEGDVRALLEELAQLVPSQRTPPALVLKIETKKAVSNLPLLIVRAMGKLPTGVMIARGDLAMSRLASTRIAEMQEEILWLCEAAHVPVIWATQVLEGMAKQGVPTRAEATDAAMAARAECVMLNKGPRIIDAVKMLATLLSRMHGHQYKKTPQLRVLHAWESAFRAGGRNGSPQR